VPETQPTAAQLMRAYYAALDAPDLDRLDGLFHDEIDWRFPGQTLTSGAALKRSMERTIATGLRMNHRIGHMLEQGDTDGFFAWKRIAKAIDDLSRPKPTVDESFQ